MHGRRVVVLFLLLWPIALFAQDNEDWDELMQTLAEDYGATSFEGDESESWLAQAEELSDLHEHPFDINTATRQTLSQLPFLTRAEIDAIFDYRARYGAFRSIGELMFLSAVSVQHLRWLRLFVFVTPPAAEQLRPPSRGVRQEVLARVNIPFYERAGWPWARGIANRLRYTGQWNQRWDIGLRAEKDAGEPMFNRQNPLWDAWGGHAMLKDWHWVQALVVGDYQASFGEGIVLNNGFQLGKQLTGLWRQSSMLRPHRSVEESRYLRGIAATLNLSEAWSLTALYSYRQLDATVYADNTVRSVNVTGLHRTPSELSHRNTLGNHTTAIHAAWQRRFLRIGATGTYLYYDHVFRQGTTLYRQIYPEGYQFAAVGADYAVHFSHLYFSGETAHSWGLRGDGWATLNKATWRFNSNTQIAVVQRFYGQDYYAPHATAFGESNRVQNESGVGLFFNADRLGPLALNAFFDYFYHPWPRFTMTRASHGYEASLQAALQPRRHSKYILRYSVKSKEQSDVRHVSHRLRATYTRQWSAHWATQATAMLHLYTEPALHTLSKGFAVFPRVSYSTLDDRLRGSLMLAWFDTQDYDSRIYTFEPSLANSFGLAMLDGRGERLALTLRYRLLRWQVQLKLGMTHYRDRSTISSGPTLIRSPFRSELQLQFVYRFRGYRR